MNLILSLSFNLSSWQYAHWGVQKSVSGDSNGQTRFRITGVTAMSGTVEDAHSQHYKLVKSFSNMIILIYTLASGFLSFSILWHFIFCGSFGYEILSHFISIVLMVYLMFLISPQCSLLYYNACPTSFVLPFQPRKSFEFVTSNYFEWYLKQLLCNRQNLFGKDFYLLQEPYILFYDGVLLGETKYLLYFRLFICTHFWISH